MARHFMTHSSGFSFGLNPAGPEDDVEGRAGWPETAGTVTTGVAHREAEVA